MKEQRIWLRRSVAVAAVAVLATLALAPASASASVAPAATGAAVQDVAPASDFGVQHVGQTWFTGFGCTYHGRSGPAGSGGQFAVTTAASGSGCPRSMVRARWCSSTTCGTSSWRTGGAPEVWAPSGYQIIWSEHKCQPCVLTSRINH